MLHIVGERIAGIAAWRTSTLGIAGIAAQDIHTCGRNVNFSVPATNHQQRFPPINILIIIGKLTRKALIEDA